MKILFLLVFISLWNVVSGRIVSTAGYEGPYQGKNECRKIWVQVYDMTTDTAGTDFAKILGFGYFVQGECSGADYPDSGGCRTVMKNGVAIFNGPMSKNPCITDLVAENEAVERTCLAASTFASHQIKMRRLSTSTIDAVYDKDLKVLHLRLQFPSATTSSYTVAISTTDGKQLYTQSWSTTAKCAAYSIDVQDFPEGSYHISLSDRAVLNEQMNIFLN